MVNNIVANTTIVLNPNMMTTWKDNVDYKADQSDFAYDLHQTCMKFGYASEFIVISCRHQKGLAYVLSSPEVLRNKVITKNFLLISSVLLQDTMAYHVPVSSLL